MLRSLIRPWIYCDKCRGIGFWYSISLTQYMTDIISSTVFVFIWHFRGFSGLHLYILAICFASIVMVTSTMINLWGDLPPPPLLSRANPYSDVFMSSMAYQITSLTIVYSIVYSGADDRKRKISASLAFVRRIHRWTVNSPHKGPVTRNVFIWWCQHGISIAPILVKK